MKAYLIGKFAAFIFKLLGLTFRYKLNFLNPNDETFFHDYSKHRIIAFFHQDELCLLNYFAHKNFAGMISMSKDGEIMSHVIQSFGYSPIRGSSSRGAVKALLSVIKKVKSGSNLVHAVDGPRGPIYKVKEGVISIQNKTEVPIIPVRVSIEHVKIFEKAWNKAKLPLPFARITINISNIKSNYTALELESTLKDMG